MKKDYKISEKNYVIFWYIGHFKGYELEDLSYM